jgi:hypothetical protein
MGRGRDSLDQFSLSCSGSLFLSVLFWLSCFYSPVMTVLSCLGCPALIPYAGCLVYFDCPGLVVSSWQVLSWRFCHDVPELASCPYSFDMAVLSLLSCPGCPVLTLFWLTCSLLSCSYCSVLKAQFSLPCSCTCNAIVLVPVFLKASSLSCSYYRGPCPVSAVLF